MSKRPRKPQGRYAALHAADRQEARKQKRRELALKLIVVGWIGMFAAIILSGLEGAK